MQQQPQRPQDDAGGVPTAERGGREGRSNSGGGSKLKLSAKDAGDASHKKAIKFLQKELPEVQKALRTFTEEIHKK